MKALIFNSGLGSRLGNLTKETPKCMMRLYNGETILHRQLRLLYQAGINDFVITTGPFEDMIKKTAASISRAKFTFVNNPVYDQTNYIMSMFLAKQYLDDDCLILHGDLVFNRKLVERILKKESADMCIYNSAKALPEKDFKCRLENGFLREVSINIFDEDCYAFQPFYNLSKDTFTKWLDKVTDYINQDNKKVYAENALNEILNKLSIEAVKYDDYYIDEIDNEDDYHRVSNEIKFYDYREQIVEESCKVSNNNTINGDIENNEEQKDKEINCSGISYLMSKAMEKRLFIVCGENVKKNILMPQLMEAEVSELTIFSDFSPNPKWEQIQNGKKAFEELSQKGIVDAIVSIGGGSCIDVAKMIKKLVTEENKFIFPEHISIPTTAGSGSESTGAAVFYEYDKLLKDWKKKSVGAGALQPERVILDANFLTSLPEYHKKSSLIDALSQAIESYWSVKSTAESRDYARLAIRKIIENYKDYLCLNASVEKPADNVENSANNTNKSIEKTKTLEVEREIMLASNYAGKAINLTATTAAHAMSYSLTTHKSISHGHAVGLCLVPCWAMLMKEGNLETQKRLFEISESLGCEDLKQGYEFLKHIIGEMKFPDIRLSEEEVARFACGVDVDRLGNFPLDLSRNENVLQQMYAEI